MKVVLQNVTKVFPSRNKNDKDEVVAVNDFDLEIPDGKLVCLLGPSGCGKSTTLYMISGLQEPSSGKIFFGEDDVTKLSPENRGIGLVFQNYALYPHLTVQQNILFPLQNLKGENRLSKEEMLTRAMKAAKLVQIEEYMKRKPSELSGGQQQRVAIARALVKMPRVLLLDEPLSNLDARLRLQTREEIRRIQRSTKITTIFVTHDQEEAMSIADFIVIMKLGVIMQTGKPQWVYDDPANLFVAKFLGTPPINVFNGKVENGKLFIGNEEVMEAEGVEDQEVYVGIRPEGFKLDMEEGKLTCEVSGVDVMGRDISVVSTNDNAITPVIRSIISADQMASASAETVKFTLKKNKVYLFNKKTEERIYFGAQLTAHKKVIAQMEAEGQKIVTHVGPLPREADDLAKENIVPEAPKNVFVRALDWVKGLFKKKKTETVVEEEPEHKQLERLLTKKGDEERSEAYDEIASRLAAILHPEEAPKAAEGTESEAPATEEGTPEVAEVVAEKEEVPEEKDTPAEENNTDNEDEA